MEFDPLDSASSAGRKGRGWTHWIVAGVVSLGALAWANRERFQTGSRGPAEVQGAPLQANPQGGGEGDLEFVDFAENFVVGLNNISYTSLADLPQHLAPMVSDDLLASISKNSLDVDFRRSVSDRKIYVAFQRVERSTIEARRENQLAIRVSGFNHYRSDLTGTQIEVPFACTVVVERQVSGLRITNFQSRL